MKELERVSVKAIGFVSYFKQYLLSDYKSFFLEQDEEIINTCINIYKY